MSNLLITDELPDLAKGLVIDALDEGYAKGRNGWQEEDCSCEALQDACQRALDNGEWHKVTCYATMIAAKQGAKVL